MPRLCEICGKGVHAGRAYARRGMARYKGGAGRKITGKRPRKFEPNLQNVRAIVGGTVKRLRVCTRCIKSGRVTKPSPRSKAPAAAQA